MNQRRRRRRDGRQVRGVALSAGVRMLALGAMTLAVSTAWGQGRAWTLTPAFSASQIVTDNRDLTENGRQAEAITVLSPSLRLSSRGPRSQASVDYALSGLIYARDSGASDIQQALRAAASAELVQQHVFIDAQASISQQSVSALQGFAEPQLGTGAGAGGGAVGGVVPGVDANRTEVRSISVSPSVRGRPFGQAEFRAGLDTTYTDNSGGFDGGSSSQRISASLGDNSRTIGWGVSGSRTVNDFSAGRKTTSDAAGLRLSYTPWPELSFFVNGGMERNDVRSAGAESYSTWGGGVNWRPGPRTQLGAQANRQFFGNGWALNASHRFRRTVFSYSDSRNVTGNTVGTGVSLSVYDLFFQQFASLEPDPALRDVLVRNFLLASGLDPNERISAGFLSRALSIQRSQSLAMSLSGQRTSYVLTAFATSTRRADSLSNAVDDLSGLDQLRQYGVSASVSHRLTPSTAVVFSGGGQRTRTGTAASDSGIKYASLTWTGSPGPRTAVSLSARHVIATGVRPYDVTSLYATLNYRF